MHGLNKQAVDEWLPTTATITTSKQLFLGQESSSNEGYFPPEYRVAFSYQVGERVFEGTYRATSFQETGHTFEILYDPRDPGSNTGSDTLNNSWYRWAAISIGIGLTLLAIWLWGDRAWFNS